MRRAWLEWEAERDRQKAAGKRARWTKPVRESLHPAIAKPKKRDFMAKPNDEEMDEEDEMDLNGVGDGIDESRRDGRTK